MRSNAFKLNLYLFILHSNSQSSSFHIIKDFYFTILFTLLYIFRARFDFKFVNIQCVSKIIFKSRVFVKKMHFRKNSNIKKKNILSRFKIWISSNLIHTCYSTFTFIIQHVHFHHLTCTTHFHLYYSTNTFWYHVFWCYTLFVTIVTNCRDDELALTYLITTFCIIK